MRTGLCFTMLCFALVLPSSTLHAIASDIPLTIRIGGEVPENLYLDDGNSNTLLQLSESSFSGKMAVPDDASFHMVHLVAEYSNQLEKTIPLRLRQGMIGVSFKLNYLSQLLCNDATVRSIEQQTTNVDQLVRSYLIARDLHYSRNTESPCGSYMMARVNKAWFDRSYGLSILRPYFALDPDAQAAYAAMDAVYTQRYVDQNAANQVKLINDMRIAEVTAGNYQAAFELNNAMVFALETDSHLSKVVTRYQGLSLLQLQTEGAVLKAKAF